MSLEVIKKIADVEAEAEKQRADALNEAKRIVTNAEAAGREVLQKMRIEAEAEVSKRHEEAQVQGKAVAAEISEKVRADCAALEKTASTKMDAAVSIIVERVVNG